MINKLNNLKMGNSSNVKASQPNSTFQEGEWEEYNRPQNKELGDYCTLRNIHTDELIDKYQVFFSSEEDYQNYLQSFKWRKRDPHIVRTYHYQPIEHRQFCSSSFSLIVYIYHPKGRLSQFRDIPYPDNLYCIMAMLDGYKKIFDKIGKFYLAEEQVCIDEDGEIRVWVNSDLSKNYPQIYEDEKDNFAVDEEAQMVEQIMYMIINNTDTSTEPNVRFCDFLEREKRTKRLTFEEGKAIVHDYARFNNDHIPAVFQAFISHINQDEEDKFKSSQHYPSANLQKSKSIDHLPFKPQSVQIPHINSQQLHPRTPLLHQNPIFAQKPTHFVQQHPINPPFTPVQPMHTIKPQPYIQVSRQPIIIRQNLRPNPYFSPQYTINQYVSPPPRGPMNHHIQKSQSPPPNFIIQGHRQPVMMERKQEKKIEPFIREQRIMVRQKDKQKCDSEVDEENVMRELMELRQLERTESSKYKWKVDEIIQEGYQYEKAQRSHSRLDEGYENRKSRLYHTLDEEKEIDPEIAADLLLYT